MFSLINLLILKELVEVIWDENNIPHIFAQNEHDLYIAQGYIVAQDRLWQMDFISRVYAGRLSEIIGYNSKLSAIDAAVLNIRLKYLNWYVKKRNLNAALYQDILSSKKIKFQSVYENATSAWRNFPKRITSFQVVCMVLVSRLLTLFLKR